jgi:hypothetical protein
MQASSEKLKVVANRYDIKNTSPVKMKHEDESGKD